MVWITWKMYNSLCVCNLFCIDDIDHSYSVIGPLTLCSYTSVKIILIKLLLFKKKKT